MKTAANLAWWFSICAMWTACLLNIVLSWRSIRQMRATRRMRERVWAYEKELIGRGVTIPPHCAFCAAELPLHDEDCFLAPCSRVKMRVLFRYEGKPPDLEEGEQDPYDRSPRY